jgi:hypothetical protein
MNLYKVPVLDADKNEVSYNIYVVADGATTARIYAENSILEIASRLRLAIGDAVKINNIVTDGEYKDRLIIQYRSIAEDIRLNTKVAKEDVSDEAT